MKHLSEKEETARANHAARGPNVIEHFGDLRTDRPIYRPLDTVHVDIRGRVQGETRATIRAEDPHRRPYFEAALRLEGNMARVSFTCGGPLGNHYLFLQFHGQESHSRYVNFRLQAESTIETADADIDLILPFTRDHMILGRREYRFPAGKMVGYISADTFRFDGIWLRDSVYGMPAYAHWERDLACMMDRFLDAQDERGMIPDGVHRNGQTWRVGLESDVEYILVLGVFDTWKATGDDAWLARTLPQLRGALRYVMSDPIHWDQKVQLVKRQHSCDTWDYDIDGTDDDGTTRHVVATCDQSGYFAAFVAMARMCAVLGENAEADHWQKFAEEYRQRAVNLLWDGAKFRHHRHLDAIDHADFDESQQLAMGNTWAITRGLTDAVQGALILNEYERRWKTTGDAFPWWSLQPGYPDRLGYWKHDVYRQQGGYANGGLMPWVGGELSTAAFKMGRSDLGVKLLRQYAKHLRDTGGAHVWYWPDGAPGFRTNNEVPYAGWGMGQWIGALFAGAAGLHDLAGQFRQVSITPRWSEAGISSGYVCYRYAASDAYVAYRWSTAGDTGRVTVTCTSGGESTITFNRVPSSVHLGPRTGYVAKIEY